MSSCLREYRTLGEKIFGQPRHLHVRRILLPRSKYDSDDFEEIIADFVARENKEPSNGLPNHSSWYYAMKFMSTRFNRVCRKIGLKDIVAYEEEEIPHLDKFNHPHSHCKTLVFATLSSVTS